MDVTDGAAAAAVAAAACPVLISAAGTTVRAVPPNCRRLAATAVHANGPIAEPPPSPPVNKPNRPPATPETAVAAPTEATGAAAPVPGAVAERASATGVGAAVCVGWTVTDAVGTASLAAAGVSASQVRTESATEVRAARAGGIRVGLGVTATGLPCAGELLAEVRADAAGATADAERAVRREDDFGALAVPVWDLGDAVVDDASVPPLSADAIPAPGAPVNDTPRANAAAPIRATLRPAINRPLLINENFFSEN